MRRCSADRPMSGRTIASNSPPISTRSSSHSTSSTTAGHGSLCLVTTYQWVSQWSSPVNAGPTNSMACSLNPVRCGADRTVARGGRVRARTEDMRAPTRSNRGPSPGLLRKAWLRRCRDRTNTLRAGRADAPRPVDPIPDGRQSYRSALATSENALPRSREPPGRVGTPCPPSPPAPALTRGPAMRRSRRLFCLPGEHANVTVSPVRR